MAQILSLLASIRWQDLVDITFNSYILFRLYVLFRETNAFRILVGLAGLWLFQRVAGSLGLIITSWALQGITAAAAIIIVVVFRNEIRTALQVRNLRTFLWGFPSREQSSPLEIVVDVVYQMGKKRIGALIVFPGKEDLSEIVHGGIPWQGTLSKEMIMSIFWPKGPVHDGAILLEGNQIREVGVLLPLSQRQDLPTFYGTRHRAAAGLAERTDALVVVVSEERGRVSVAKNHWIRPVGQPEELLLMLREHFQILHWLEASKQKRERWQTAVAAVLSLLVITSIWLGFTRSRDTIFALTVPIEFYNRPANFEILDTSASEARLQLNGSSALIKSLRPGQVEVRLDLSKAGEGANTIPITTENVTLPPGILVNRVDPAEVEIRLDKLASKDLPVQVDWVGRLPPGLILVDAKVSPNVVRVIGGGEILDRINTLFTAPVRLESLQRSGSLTASLVLTPASIKLAANFSDRVTVQYRLVDRTYPEEEKSE
jgi:uncharacterized protein (TIGR00159 family)